jgi:hypothetical protein
MSTDTNKRKSFLIIGGIVIVLVIIIIAVSSMITGKTQSIEATTAAELVTEQAATLAAIPTETATIAPTIEPSPTATMAPTSEPTNTPIPPLGLSEEGVILWSAPMGTDLIPANFVDNQDDYQNISVASEENGEMVLKIPASFIVMDVHFNQSVPSGVQLKVYEMKALSPWYTAPMTLSPEDSNSGYFLIFHSYMINPPFWEMTYHVKIEGANGIVFWEKDVKFLKPTPNTCWDGSLPNPVTLYCPNYDGDWNYLDFENFNQNADIFTSGQVPLPDKYKK